MADEKINNNNTTKCCSINANISSKIIILLAN